MLLMLKACDISNEARPLRTTEKWVDCLLTEFFHQVRYEGPCGLDHDLHCILKLSFSFLPLFPLLTCFFMFRCNGFNLLSSELNSLRQVVV